MKKTVQIIIIFLFILSFSFDLKGTENIQTEDTIKEGVFKETIKTVKLHRKDWVMSYPLMELNGGSDLTLSFDDLSDEVKNYNYKIIHCDSEWLPSQISETEYLDGYLQNRIDDYNFSFNTYISYIHYNLNLPNDDVNFKISGNYAIIVYENYDESDIVLIKRFQVAEKIIDISGEVQRPVLTIYRNTGQQVNFRVNYSALNVEDPYNDLKVVILQNGRWDNRIKNIRPLFDKNQILEYDNQAETVFPGGNEFRWFDMKSLRYQSPYIKNVDFSNGQFYVDLFPDKNRSGKQYFYEQDFNGRYYIEIQEEEKDEISADYVEVNFEFPYDAPAVNGNFYLFGELTNWGFHEKNKMVYDFETKSYHLDLLLKQGYYNYHYIYLPEGSSTGQTGLMEGDHYETENDYIILVYYYGSMSRYERLAGYQIINSLHRSK